MSRLEHQTARIHIRLWKSDWEDLQEIARLTGQVPSDLVRRSVHQVVLRLKDLERQKIDQIPSKTLEPETQE